MDAVGHIIPKLIGFLTNPWILYPALVIGLIYIIIKKPKGRKG